MAAVPEPEPIGPSPAAEPCDPCDVVGDCRRYVLGGARLGARELSSLALIERCLTEWRCARLLDCAADPALRPPPPVPLGAFVRSFVGWLDSHPPRTGEPLEWLVEAALRSR